MNAKDFAPLLGQNLDDRRKFRFSLETPERLAEQIRAFADKVEKGEYVLQNARTGANAEDDEYLIYHLSFDYVIAEVPKA